MGETDDVVVGDKLRVDYYHREEAENLLSLIGQKIKKIETNEYGFELTASNNKKIVIKGSRWDGCSLGIEVEDEKTSMS